MRRWPPGVVKARSRPARTQLTIVRSETPSNLATSPVVYQVASLPTHPWYPAEKSGNRQKTEKSNLPVMDVTGTFRHDSHAGGVGPWVAACACVP